MERFFPKRSTENQPPEKEKKDDEIDPSRRFFLKAALAAAVASTVPGDTVREGGEQRESPPTPEKVNHFESAKRQVQEHVVNMRRLPFMERPLRARAQVAQVPTNSDFKSVVLGIMEDGVIKTLNVPDVGGLSQSVRDNRGKGIYIHTEGATKYRITLKDSPVDIGVSNRFRVEKHVHAGGPEKFLSVYAVRRARYERKLVEKEIVEKGKKKKIKVDEGGYVEYVTYVPPGEHLVKKEVVGAGKEYIDVILNAAHKTLSDRLPKANQKILAICRDVCRRLAVVEHVDPKLLNVAEQKEEGKNDIDTRRKLLFQKMYAEYGLNQDAAFNHLINGLGAGGMMQIMQKTYRDIRTRLLERNIFLSNEIPEDANIGRKDPLISAIVAMYLCYDNYLPRTKFFSTKRDDEIELSLVAMYNGSPNLYRQILEGNKPEKGKKSKESPTEHPPIPYKNPTELILKMLNHNHGMKLPGTNEPENRNYLRKYLLLKSYEKTI